jgi:hypothetical protein
VVGDGGRGDCKALILEGEDLGGRAGEGLDISQRARGTVERNSDAELDATVKSAAFTAYGLNTRE